MDILGRDQILAVKDLEHTEIVDVPEWNGKVMVRMLSGKDRDRLDEMSISDKGKNSKSVNLTNFRARLVAACICDDEGNRIFPEADIAKLGEKSAAALDRVYTVAAKINRISKEDVDELLGNSDGDQSAVSGSN